MEHWRLLFSKALMLLGKVLVY
jgi:hypothetical protein